MPSGPMSPGPLAMADLAVPLVDPRAEQMLRLAVGPGEPTRLTAAMEIFEVTDARLVGLGDGDHLFGVVGFRHDGGDVRIQHLAVRPEVQGRGWGRVIVDWLASACPGLPLVAETDDDAVGFYRRCGFRVTPLGETYPGVERYAVRRPPNADPAP